MKKRESARAIIFYKNQMVLMYREKNNQVYYAIPGGGIDDGETEKQCVVRELKEEFGIDIEVKKKVYVYSDSVNIHHYFLCSWNGENFGTGVGEEFTDPNKKGGVYIPKLMPISELKNLPIVPPEVKIQLISDIDKFGPELQDTITSINGNF